MRVFNKYKLFMVAEYSWTLNSPWTEECHLRKVEKHASPLTNGFVQTKNWTYGICDIWESECTTKEYHMMWYAKKARIRKKYRNKIERRL